MIECHDHFHCIVTFDPTELPRAYSKSIIHLRSALSLTHALSLCRSPRLDSSPQHHPPHPTGLTQDQRECIMPETEPEVESSRDAM